MNADDVQIMDGPSASFVHHGAAWVMELVEVNAVEALLVLMGGSVVGLFAVVAVVATAVSRFDKDSRQQ